MMENRRDDPASFGSVSMETRSSKVLKASFTGAKIECRLLNLKLFVFPIKPL